MHFYDVAVYSQNEHEEQSVTNLQKRSFKGLCNLLAHIQLEIAEKLLNRGEVRYTPFLSLIQFSMNNITNEYLQSVQMIIIYVLVRQERSIS